MEWTVEQSDNFEEEQARANYPQIRMITVKQKFEHRTSINFEGNWRSTTPQSVGSFSAVGYYFGRELYTELNVPIGLISSSWGGTPIHSWTPMRTLEKFPDVIAYRDLKIKQAKKITVEKVEKENKIIIDEWKAAKERSKITGEKVRQWPRLKDTLCNRRIFMRICIME